MKLSIILITYNHSAFIRQCLDSILMQQVNVEVELVVADDFSTDNTLTFIKEALIGTTFNAVYLDSSRNVGFVKNYQRAFDACSGKYIAVIEGDDYWTNPRRLEMHIAFLEEHQECTMSMNRFIIYHQSEVRFRLTDWPYKEDYIYVTGQEMAVENKLGNMSACVFRKSAMDKIKINLFDMLIADWMIGMVLCEFGLIAILKTATSVYRVHNNGQYSKMTPDERLALMNKHIDEYDSYLNGRYAEEFKQHRQRLAAHPSRIQEASRLSDFLPPIVLTILKMATPKVVVKKWRARY